eukprot:GHUV01046599.1.p1 GENE.GHUV01046599.1~~GHUV01046599.1.p1  ORF type:complete len:148 (-),score=0.96 GHUV01046599.1:55-498(-)
MVGSRFLHSMHKSKDGWAYPVLRETASHTSSRNIYIFATIRANLPQLLLLLVTQTCRELVSKTCRCGRTQKEVLCHTDVRCDSKCTNMRNCGRHQCKRRCCDGESCPPCEEVCNRKLRCGNHRCPAPCHSGPCRWAEVTVAEPCLGR